MVLLWKFNALGSALKISDQVSDLFMLANANVDDAK